MERYCQRMADVLADADQAERLFDQAAEVLYAIEGMETLDRDVIHTQPFTERIIEGCVAANITPSGG
jgi:hypothetical protein